MFIICCLFKNMRNTKRRGNITLFPWKATAFESTTFRTNLATAEA